MILTPGKLLAAAAYQPAHTLAGSRLGCRNQATEDTTDQRLPHKGAPPVDRRRAAGGIK